MDPLIIGAGINLLGGLFSKPKPKYVVPDYAGIRRKAEAAGFNPLTALTQGPQGSVVEGGNSMGTAIADAGLMLADSLAKSKKTGILSRVQTENAELRDKVNNLTLRPKVPGVYAQRQSVPSVPSALGVSDVPSSGLSASASVADVPDSKLPAGVSFGGVTLYPAPGFSDAERIESRYGDIAQSFIGMGVLAADAAHYVRKQTDRAAMVRETERRQARINNPFNFPASADAYNLSHGRQRPGFLGWDAPPAPPAPPEVFRPKRVPPRTSQEAFRRLDWSR